MRGQREGLPFVTVYGITYKQKDIVKATVLGLFSQNYPSNRYEIVILDDGSDDGTKEMLEKLAEHSPVPMRVLAVKHEAHYLSAKRYNQCIAAASQETKVFVQVDDVRVRGDFIWQHVKWHLQEGDFLVTGAKFEGETETWDLAACRRGYLAGPDGSAVECDFQAAWGASLSFTRRMMERVWQEPYDKPYDERMTGWGYHEIELAWRMKQAGARVIYDPAAGVFHQCHTERTEWTRGLDRERLIREGTEQNVKYICEKHGFKELPEWSEPRELRLPEIQLSAWPLLAHFSHFENWIGGLNDFTAVGQSRA